MIPLAPVLSSPFFPVAHAPSLPPLTYLNPFLCRCFYVFVAVQLCEGGATPSLVGTDVCLFLIASNDI